MNDIIIYALRETDEEKIKTIKENLIKIFSKLTKEQTGCRIFIQREYFSFTTLQTSMSLRYESIREIKIRIFSDFFEICIWHGKNDFLNFNIQGKYSEVMKQ